MLQRAVELYSLKVLYYLCVSFILQWCSHFGYPLSFWRTNHVEGEIVCAYNEYNLHPRGLEMQFTKLNTTNNSLNIDLSVVKLFLWRLKKKKKKNLRNCHTSHCYSHACLGSDGGSCQKPDISAGRRSRDRVESLWI